MGKTLKTPDSTDSEEMLQELSYLRRISERNVAKILALDAQSIAIRYELEHKRRGFALLSELAVSLRNSASYDAVFVPVARRINAALNMQRTAVLVSDGAGVFVPAVLQGYPADRFEIIASRCIEPDEELLRSDSPVIVTGADPAERLRAFREAVEIEYIISAPILLYDGTVAAILVTGRTVEENPFFSRLNKNNVETVSAICALLGAVLVEQNLLSELRQARDQAERSDKAKGKFLANVSHEIRTPINVILGMIRLMDKFTMNQEQREYMNHAEHSTRLLLRIFDDIMDFSNLDTGHLALKTVEFSVRDTLKNVLNALQAQALNKSLSLNTNVSPDVPAAISGDALRVEQVLLNLTDNAIKFTEEGRIDIRVTCDKRQEPQPGKVSLMFEVEDTGIGIGREDMAGLFLPFAQANSSFNRKYGGTGLGLAISRSLVKLMKGEIYCESTLGKGSKFSFSIEFELPGEPAVSGETNGIRDLNGMRVLLAEDNEINQMVAESILSDMGISVTIAVNGLEAIEAIEKDSYDLVLMDIQMPEMDGLVATSKIRANPKFKDLPIIALTAHALPEDRDVSLRTGMNEHLTKPIDPELLYRVLREYRGHASFAK